MKQLVTRAQLIVEEIGEGFDPGNALESGVGQYPKVGVQSRGSPYFLNS